MATTMSNIFMASVYISNDRDTTELFTHTFSIILECLNKKRCLKSPHKKKLQRFKSGLKGGLQKPLKW